MVINKIEYSSDFVKRLNKLPENIFYLTRKKEHLFKENPLHPSLRLHELHGSLKGFWSISISSGYRIIFKRKADGGIVFVSIGKHDIYKNL